MEKIKWGIIGCGDVTEKKSGPGFQKANGSELVAVMRRNERLAQDYAKRHGVGTWYSNAKELISDPSVNAIYIASPPSTHNAYIKLAADAGKPVYCEKPMTTGYRESAEAVHYCEERNVPLFVAYYRRGLEKYLFVKSLLEKEKIGNIRTVTVQLVAKPTIPGTHGELPWRVKPEISGGGLILDVGSHGLDILDYYLGPIVRVKGFSTNLTGNYNAEDLVTGTWVHDSGVFGMGCWNFAGNRNEDWIQIEGSMGAITFSVLDVSGPVKVLSEGTEELFHFESPEHVQQPLIQLITNELLGGASSPSTGSNGLRTDWVLEQLRKPSAD